MVAQVVAEPQVEFLETVDQVITVVLEVDQVQTLCPLVVQKTMDQVQHQVAHQSGATIDYSPVEALKRVCEII